VLEHTAAQRTDCCQMRTEKMHDSKDADALVGLSDAWPVSIVSDSDSPIDNIRLAKVYSKISSRVLPLLMIVVILNHIGKYLLVV